MNDHILGLPQAGKQYLTKSESGPKDGHKAMRLKNLSFYNGSVTDLSEMMSCVMKAKTSTISV